MSPFGSLFILWMALISAILHCYASQYITTTKEAYLYAYQLNRPSYITINMLKDVTAYLSSTTFELHPYDTTGFNLQLSLDSPLVFHPTQITKLRFEIGSNTPINKSIPRDIIVSFSQSDTTYISTFLTLDKTDDHMIYPSCDTTYPYTQQFANGSIQSIMDQFDANCDRYCKASGGTPPFGDFTSFQPTTRPPNVSYPLTFILENHPIQNYMTLTYTNPGITARTCGFAMAMIDDIPLDIYIAAEDPLEIFEITYFNITHTLYATYSPTMVPTTNPTINPTVEPTDNPTTAIPTDHPSTSSPTGNPITAIPSTDPTNKPSIDPTIKPSLDPTITPTNESTVNPTINPSFSPTLEPTMNGIDAGIDGLATDKQFDFDLVLMVTSGIMVFFVILSILDCIHSSNDRCLCCCGHRSDVFGYKIIIIIGLRICNMVFDITILYRMCMYYLDIDENEDDVMILILICCSCLSLIITYLINLFCMNKIVKLESKSEGPMLWFTKYMLFFVCLVFLTCDSYLTLKLISSNIFGMNLFNSGHCTMELNKIRIIKIATIVLQNVAQIMIQMMFGMMVLKQMNTVIIVAMSIGFILSIPLLIIWSVANINNKLSIWQQYDIEILLIPSNPSNNNDKTVQIGQIMKYGGYKGVLRQRLSRILGINACKLEIGYLDRNETGNGRPKIHILQQVPCTRKHSANDSKMDLRQLYDGKYTILAKELKEIYHISPDWDILCSILMYENDEYSKNNNNVDSDIDGNNTQKSTEMIDIKINGNITNINTNKHHDIIPSKSTYTPFELVTSGSDGDYDEEFVNKILDEKKRQIMAMHGTSLKVIDNNLNIKKSPSVIAVTPIGDDCDDINLNESSSSTSSDDIDNDMDDEQVPDLPNSVIDHDDFNDHEFKKHFNKKMSINEDIPDVPNSVSQTASDVFGVGSNDDNPFFMQIMPKIDEIPQPMVNIDDITPGHINDDDYGENNQHHE